MEFFSNFFYKIYTKNTLQNQLIVGRIYHSNKSENFIYKYSYAISNFR